METTDEFWPRFEHDPRSFGHLRAGIRDRDVVSQLLADSYAEGRLDLEEFEDRTERLAAAKTLAEIPPLVADLVTDAEANPAALTHAGSGIPHSEQSRLAALARLNQPIPLTPEQIDAAAEEYWRRERRKALIGILAGPSGICVLIWAISSISAGFPIFFWPLFVILGTGIGAVKRITSKDEIIAKRKAKLTQQARAHLGDETARAQLTSRRRDSDREDAEEGEDEHDEAREK